MSDATRRADHRASPARTARSWPSCCSRRATRSPGSSATARRDARLLRAPARRSSSSCGATCSSRRRCATAIERRAPERDLPPRRALVRARVVGAPGGDDAARSRARRAAILEAVRELDAGTRVFVAASGAMFGDAPESPQREDTPCRPHDALRDRQARRPPARRRAARRTTACTPARASSSTTSPSAGPSSSSRAGSPAAPPRSRSGAQQRAHARLAASGARLVVRRRHRARRLADAPAGQRPTTTCSPAASGTRWRSSRRRPSRASGSTPSATCASTPSSCARPSARRASATRARRASGSAGGRACRFEQLVRAHGATPTCARCETPRPRAERGRVRLASSAASSTAEPVSAYTAGR